MKSHLKNHLQEIHSIPENLIDGFLDHWHPLTAGKKEIITDVKAIEKYLYFTVEGVQKAYYITGGKYYNIAFTYPYAFTCIPESFLTQRPSHYCFECISDSTFLRINHSDFFRFVENHHEFETLLRKSLTGILGGVINRYHRLLALGMEDRFRDLMRNSPQLLNMVPQKEIANYLKMDPTNFSKLINSIRI